MWRDEKRVEYRCSDDTGCGRDERRGSGGRMEEWWKDEGGVVAKSKQRKKRQIGDATTLYFFAV